MKWLKNRWLRYTHQHNYEVVACAEYIHVNKFTRAEERFPAVWLRCACGHEKAEAIVTSFTLSVRIPIEIKKWKRMTVGLKKAEHAPKDSVLLKTAPAPRLPVPAALKSA